MSELCIICSNSHCQHSPRVVGRTPMVATMYAKFVAPQCCLHVVCEKPSQGNHLYSHFVSERLFLGWGIPLSTTKHRFYGNHHSWGFPLLGHLETCYSNKRKLKCKSRKSLLYQYLHSVVCSHPGDKLAKWPGFFQGGGGRGCICLPPLALTCPPPPLDMLKILFYM